MSTSVCNALNRGLLTRTAEIIDKRHHIRSEIRRAKRDLFGPVDHEETRNFLNEELAKINCIDSNRWNFDFKRETTLDPEGLYIWQTATPPKMIRAPKRRQSVDEECEEWYFTPLSPIKPMPMKAKIDVISSPQQQHQHQRLITDFMPVKKRSTSEITSKIDWNLESRPAKRSRLTDLS